MCGRSGGAEGREEAPGGGGVRLRKEEPHTKMWGISVVVQLHDTGH